MDYIIYFIVVVLIVATIAGVFGIDVEAWMNEDNKGKLICYHCKKKITDAREDMVIYHGRATHYSCFRKLERANNGRHKPAGIM